MNTLEWIGVVTIIAGSIPFIIPKLVKLPKFRIVGFVSYILSSIFMLKYSLDISSESYVVLNIIFFGLNFYGIYGCVKEIKNGK